jgi:hypothetical protein
MVRDLPEKLTFKQISGQQGMEGSGKKHLTKETAIQKPQI